MNMNMKRLKINKLILLLVVALAATSIFGCSIVQKDEPIIYGDIDFDAEVIEQSRPKTLDPHDETVGNTYLNLLNGGYFCESEKDWYYVVLYNGEKYLIKQDKDSNDTVSIYHGDIRNIFVFNGWIYGIVRNGSQEYMVVMDVYGNNQRISKKYMNNIRTMQSNGNKVYFTVDQRNITGMSLSTAIMSCDMDLSNDTVEKTVSNINSQVDIIAIYSGLIYFNETYGGNNAGYYISIDQSVEEYPIIYNDKIFTFNDYVISEIIGRQASVSCANKHKNTVYIAANYNSEEYLISYNLDNREAAFERTESKIDAIYEYSEGIVIYSNGKYERMKK